MPYLTIAKELYAYKSYIIYLPINLRITWLISERCRQCQLPSCFNLP
ncbi:uncharacterized protein FFC1_02156 [Fusarium fujikuroi]|nr:uncharacterized protein FFC1_02156 [Fusarium fujikuroi]